MYVLIGVKMYYDFEKEIFRWVDSVIYLISIVEVTDLRSKSCSCLRWSGHFLIYVNPKENFTLKPTWVQGYKLFCSRVVTPKLKDQRNEIVLILSFLFLKKINIKKRRDWKRSSAATLRPFLSHGILRSSSLSQVCSRLKISLLKIRQLSFKPHLLQTTLYHRVRNKTALILM